MNSVASIHTPAWSTPAILRLGLLTAWAAGALLMGAVLGLVFWDRANLRSVGRELAPAMEGEERLHGAIAAINRAAQTEAREPANEHAWDGALQNATGALLHVAEELSDVAGARPEVHQIGSALDAYALEIQQGRDEKQSKSNRYGEAYRHAAELMDRQIVPAEIALRQRLRDALSSAFARQEKASGILFALVVGSAMLLATILAGLQLFLAARMRRLLNPLLFFATALTVVFSLYFVQALGAETAEFQMLKRGAREGESMNKIQLEQHVETGFQDVATIEWTAPLAVLSIGALTLVGVLPRLREYGA